MLDHSATFENTIFEDNAYTGRSLAYAASVLRVHYGSQVMIRDSVIRNNRDGAAAIYVGFANTFGGAPSLNLEGCVTLEGNSPADVVDGGSYLTDSSSGSCPTDPTVKPPRPVAKDDDKPKKKSVIQENARDLTREEEIHTCPMLEPQIFVTDLTGSTQCQRLDVLGLGRAELVAAGLIDAVDVWGWVAPDTPVCFQDSGPVIVFLDAAYAPRAAELLPVFRRGNLTCTRIRGEGSVALLQSAPAGLQLPPQTAAAAPAQSPAGCMATLRTLLNFRRSPGGELIQLLPALQRLPKWIEVDYHGQRGWVSAAYVDEEGECA